MISEIDIDEMERLVDEGAVLVDVREEEEVLEGCIEGSLSWPLSRFAEFKDDVSQTNPTIFYCRSGRRSLKSAEMAEEWTDQPLYSLSGGYLAYIGEA